VQTLVYLCYVLHVLVHHLIAGGAGQQTYPTQKNLYLMMYFLLSFLSMHDTCMFVELLNNTFPLFINNVFQCCKIILKYFYSPVHVAHAQILVLYNTHITQFYIKHEVFY
jgi:hypothetical protein